ncbi:prepilin-type N-terminal cleavage/methylation domain-containing protein [Deferribacteraceae bacterium V6Fe1]|nr:prepilin-type N-terminal cleavage/methylation domain-containing protein [Deferribacteraceae bacterium V6Fe1]
MMKINKGVTIIELLVTMLILGITLSAVYLTYISVLTDFKKQTKLTETQIEKGLGLEILRLDLEHLGYGIASDTNDKAIEYDGTTLTIRSTINSTNQDTFGYAIVDCTAGSNSTYRLDQVVEISADDNVTKTRDFVVINLDNFTFVENRPNLNLKTTQLYTPCTDNATFMIFPYDNATSGCTGQFCNKISYELSTTQPLDTCNPNTKNLLRKVGSSAGMPIINCVADFKARFHLDNNSDGIPDGNQTTLSINNSDMNKLKLIDIYLLIQEGQRDKNYTSPNSYSMDGITFSLPAGYENYRWKIAKISVTPHIYGE